MSSISAGTTSVSALVSSGDTSGQLVLQTNGTTTAVTIGTNQVVTLAQPLPVASGGTGGSATPTAGGIVYGTGTVQAVTAAGTSGQVLTSAGAAAPTWGTVSAGYTLGTPVATTSGTSIDFTGIPAGVKQIVVMFRGVSTTGTSFNLVQLGNSGGIEITTYKGGSVRSANNGGAVSVTVSENTAGFLINTNIASRVMNGTMTLTLLNSATFSWAESHSIFDENNSAIMVGGGSKILSAQLDRVRITTVIGSDTFDAGEINIAYI